MTFDRIPGQDALKATISAQIETDKWPHTTLIYGPLGTPALAMARAVSQLLITHSLNSERLDNTKDKASKLIHPDIHFSYPIQGAKLRADDVLKDFRQFVTDQPFATLTDWATHHASDRGQVNISVAECNNIIKKLSLKPFEGGNKIMIIWGAEYLGREGNRLLKLLEEPPENTFLILVSEDIERILPTILSRCQTYTLSPMSEDELCQHLSEEHQVDDKTAREAVRMADGDLNRAIHLADEKQDGLEFDVSGWINMIRRGDFERMLSFSQEFAKWSKEQQKLIFVGALAKLRRVLTNIDNNDVVFSEVIGNPIDFEIVNELTGSFTSIISGLERNAHVPTLIMSESIKMWKLIKRSKAPST